jgi:hypothetical protein
MDLLTDSGPETRLQGLRELHGREGQDFELGYKSDEGKGFWKM